MKHMLLALTMLAPGAAPNASSVQIVDDSFSPLSITVAAGQSVTFTNKDDDAHTVTATDGSFDSEGLDTGGVWRHVFTKPGTYRYFCQLHPFMRGAIVVKAVAP